MSPEWPAPPWVRAVFTTRQGGTSAAPFNSLNLGTHVGDDPLAVAANRRILQQATASRPVFMQQVHGQAVLVLEPGTPDGLAADASLTQHKGLGCAVMVADCLPVLFAHLDRPLVAAAHAGWRGLSGSPLGAGQSVNEGVLEALFVRFAALAGASPAAVAARTIAWLGPCIGPSEFEVGNEVRTAFVRQNLLANDGFASQANGKYLADLPGLARQRLAGLGITGIYGNDSSPSWCTVSQSSRFFSFRRENGQGLATGRMAACIWQV